MRDEATFRVKAGLAEMLKGGVIMDVVTPAQATVAEEAGAAAVMALGRVTADIWPDGGVARVAVRDMGRNGSRSRRLGRLSDDGLPTAAKECGAAVDLVRQVAREERLPVVLFCAGGIDTPADAALMMALGAEGVFVGSGIFKSEDPPSRARAIVAATTHWQNAERVADAPRGPGPAMGGLENTALEGEQLR